MNENELFANIGDPDDKRTLIEKLMVFKESKKTTEEENNDDRKKSNKSANKK